MLYNKIRYKAIYFTPLFELTYKPKKRSQYIDYLHNNLKPHNKRLRITIFL